MLDIVSVRSSSSAAMTAQLQTKIDNLVRDIFHKVVLVPTYDDGMRIAKDHNLTCITSDLQVVYAGAFLTRGGHYNRSQMDRYTLYASIRSLKTQIEAKEMELKKVESQMEVTDKQDLEMLKDLRSAEQALRSVRSQCSKLSTELLENKAQAGQKRLHLSEIVKAIETLHLQKKRILELKEEAEEGKNQPQKDVKVAEGRLADLSKQANDLHFQLAQLKIDLVKVVNQLEQKQSLLDSSYLPKKVHIEAMMVEAEEYSKIARVSSNEGSAFSGKLIIKDLNDKLKEENTEIDQVQKDLKAKYDQLRDLVAEEAPRGDTMMNGT
mmetsp:Transcript_4485/g.6706  ORF Transcript_4485/g.6706 Transcript_4485/m.6706 type:complete len:323 (+) Transcript_4485:2037-3005(+)